MRTISPVVTVALNFVAFITSRSASLTSTQPENLLELSTHLDAFGECNIRVVLNQVDSPPEKISEFSHGSYELAPMSIPITLSKYFYQFKGKDESGGSLLSGIFSGFLPDKSEFMHCGKYLYNLQPNQERYHTHLKAQPKLNCAVVVYVEPHPCQAWFQKYFTTTYLSMPLPNGFIFPHSLLNTTLFNFGNESSAHLVKSFALFIHIRKVEPYLLNAVPAKHDIPLSIQKWYQLHELPISPLIMSFLIAANQTLVHSIVAKILQGCINHASVYTSVHEAYPLSIYKSSLSVIRRLLMYEKLQDSREKVLIESSLSLNISELEMLRSGCPQNIWMTRNGRNSEGIHYLLNLKAKTEMDEADNIVVRYIFPNSSCLRISASDPYAAEFIPVFVTMTKEQVLSYHSFSDNMFSMNFVTCAPLKQNEWLTLRGYISAFEGPVWGLFLFASLLSGLVLHALKVIIKWESSADIFELRQIVKELFTVEGYENMTFAYNIFLFQATKALRAIKSMEVTWLLGGIVLSYAYLGENITDLTSKRQPVKYQTFQELLENGVKLLSPAENGESQRLLEFSETTSKMLDVADKLVSLGSSKSNKSETFSEIALRGMIGATEFSKWFLSNGHVQNAKGITLKRLKELIVLPTSIKNHVEMMKPSYFLERIGRCDMDAYASTMEDVIQFELELKKRTILNGQGEEDEPDERILTVGKTAIGSFFRSWVFFGVDWPAEKFQSRVRVAFTSGALERWRKWILWKNNLNSSVTAAQRMKRKFRSVSLKRTNTVVIFYLQAGILAIPLFAFLIEIRGRLKNIIVAPIQILFGLSRVREETTTVLVPVRPSDSTTSAIVEGWTC